MTSATCCFHQPSIWNIRSEGYQRASFCHLALPLPEDDFLHPLKATSAGGSGLFGNISALDPWIQALILFSFLLGTAFFYVHNICTHALVMYRHYSKNQDFNCIFFLIDPHAAPALLLPALNLSARWLANIPNTYVDNSTPLNLLSLCQLDRLIPTLVLPIRSESF